MPKLRGPVAPKLYYLNEQHELSRGEKAGGGGLPKLAPINWRRKGQRLHESLSQAKAKVRDSKDPLRERRYFLATKPTKHIRKESTNAKLAPNGIFEEEVDYAGKHSQVFRRLGLDLLSVDQEGNALVHAPAARLEQLIATSEGLGGEGPKEQARWISIGEFDAAPTHSRIDSEWLETLSEGSVNDAVIEMQPLLRRVEVDEVIRAIMEAIRSIGGGRILGDGLDFSGRRWFRGRLSQQSLRLIAEQFYSVQALHPPLISEVAFAEPGARSRTIAPLQTGVEASDTLPTIAILDVGIPSGNPLLDPFKVGNYKWPDAPEDIVSDHGSRVASRVVYGDPNFSLGLSATPEPSCKFIDVNIALDAGHINDKAVMPALEAIVGTYPATRVFNLSFGDQIPLNAHRSIERHEKLILIQDLDNFALRHDVLVVIAAGNSTPGVMPGKAYPEHIDDPLWGLGNWACGFNTLKCGSYVGKFSRPSIAKPGWPSPFTRIGPGLCGATMPEYSANGGNCTDAYRQENGMGVWACNASGTWEDWSGTSMAAPLFAREAAFVLGELEKHCEEGARPYAATVKALLAITARPAEVPPRVRALASRTLGRGTATADLVVNPSSQGALMIWQGVLNSQDDLARVQVPVPREWVKAATDPTLRVIAAWESPVNAAVEHVWASRRLEMHLKTNATAKAVHPRGRAHASYPLLDRLYPLSSEVLSERSIEPSKSDVWLLEISYSQICDYAPMYEFSTNQRVGIVMELRDYGENQTSPQEAMQALPLAVSMNRLAIPENRIANPIVVRPRV